MTNTEFIMRENGGVSPLAPETARAAAPAAFGFWDLALILGFVAAFMGLIFLLAK